jgi:cytochrome c
MRAAILLLALPVLGAGMANAQNNGDAARGAKKYEECAACHKLERGDNSVGPTLHGVLDRKAAALPEYRYSPALRRSNIVWTPQTLDAFIADPQQLVPANRMPYAGMPDAADRADLIAYLRKATQ